jgi:fructose-specific phosphotransferase system IIC component
VDIEGLPGAGDDGLNRPIVTPVPAPPDDQLIRLAKVGGLIGGLATALLVHWLHKHIEIRWRR